jgi:hypothetical protein
MGLITLAEAKEYMGITDTDRDTRISSLISDWEDWLEGHCGRKFGLATYQEKYDVPFEWQNEIVLNQFPAQTINWVQVAGITLDAAEWHYDLDGGIVKLPYTNRWLKARDQVEIKYDAGYDSAPPRLKLLVKKLVALDERDRNLIGFESAKLGDYSFKKAKLNEEGFPRDIQLLLDQFIDPGL